MILPFFDINGIIHLEYVQGTIKSEDYVQILMRPSVVYMSETPVVML